MPDARAPDPTPRDWSDAFAALPLETAPTDGWSRLAAALPLSVPARSRRKRWRPAVAALAAGVALAAVLPVVRWHDAATPSSIAPAAPVAVAPDPSPAARAPSVPDAGVAATAGPDAHAATTMEPSASPATHASHRPRAARAGAPANASLAALYTESAQLEAVLAQLPDNGASNAAAVALTTELQDQVAHIDAALSQPALAEDDRAALWTQRVDTLRQLTGVETAQRWQVALSDVAYAAETSVY